MRCEGSILGLEIKVKPPHRNTHIQAQTDISFDWLPAAVWAAVEEISASLYPSSSLLKSSSDGRGVGFQFLSQNEKLSPIVSTKHRASLPVHSLGLVRNGKEAP